MENQFVVFTLAGEAYGIEIAAVEGIIKLQAITAVPHAPAYVEGVTNLRGKVLPVVDLRRRFGLPEGAETKDSRIVVVEISGVTVGMIVDGVSEVLRVSDESVEPPSPIVMTIDSAFIRGIAKLNERLIILLDLSQVLGAQQASQAAPLLAV
jgi:purine-binding chemotaxis protein CheW